MIRGSINGQSLTLEQDLVVAGTNKYLEAEFTFSPDWDPTSIWLHADKENEHWKIHLTDGRVTRDDKFAPGAGAWEICFHGTAPDGMRITTEPVDLIVRRTNVDPDLPLGEIPSDVAEQLDQRLTAVEQNGGGGGGQGGTIDHSKLINRDQPDQHPMEAITGLVALRDRINAFLDSDDSTLDQLSELIAAIKKDTGTIEQLTNGKVNKTDIINDLVSNVSDKPLSAAQGVELKRLIDAIEVPDLAAQVEAAQQAAREAAGSASQADTSAGVAQGHAVDAFNNASRSETSAEQAVAAKDVALSASRDAQAAAGDASKSVTTATEQATAATQSATTANSEADRAKREADRAEQATPKLAALTFTGASTAAYDGTKPVTVEIPQGGSGGDIGLGVTGASIGQIIEVEQVDESGKPTKWKAVEKPSGGGGGKSFTVEQELLEDVNTWKIDLPEAIKTGRILIDLEMPSNPGKGNTGIKLYDSNKNWTSWGQISYGRKFSSFQLTIISGAVGLIESAYNIGVPGTYNNVSGIQNSDWRISNICFTGKPDVKAIEFNYSTVSSVFPANSKVKIYAYKEE